MRFVRLNRAALYATLLLYVPLTLALAGGLVVVCVVLVRYCGLWFIGLALTAVGLALLLLFGLLPLFFRHVDHDAPGLPLRDDQHPKFFELLRRIAKRLKARPPDVVFVEPCHAGWIADRTIVDRDGRQLRGVRTLCFGAGNVIDCNIDEFTTLLCHELAHAAAGDTWMARLSGRFFESMALAIAAAGGSGSHDPPSLLARSIAWLLMGYFYLFALLYLRDSRARELRADRAAAEIFGPERTRRMLMKAHLLQFIPEATVDSVIGFYAENDVEVMNLYDEYRRRRARLPAVRIAAAENQMFMSPPSVWSTHPSLAQRFRALGDSTAAEWDAGRPAAQLFRDWPAIERQLSHMVIELARAGHRLHMRAIDLAARGGRMA